MADKTLREYSIPVVVNVAIRLAVNMGDANFELKTGLIMMVKANPLCGLPSEDTNAHLQHFLELLKVLCLVLVISDNT
jgi:hypothetical protein